MEDSNVILDAFYIDTLNGKSIKTVDVVEQSYDENEHLVIYYYFGSLKECEIPKLKAIKLKEFNQKFKYKGLLNELTDAKSTNQVRHELNEILDSYVNTEFDKKEDNRNSDLLNMGYEISMLVTSWIAK